MENSGENIAKGVARSAALLITARLATRLIDFVTLIVLGHLLTPVDFGLVAIAMTVMQIIEAILEMPVSIVLLRGSTEDRSRLDTAFTLGLLRGLIVAGLLFALSWPLAQFYTDPRLVALTCALSLAPALRGLLSPRMAHYAKNFQFAREFSLEIAAKAASLAAATAIAVATGSYWALAVGTIAAPLVMCVLSYILAPYRPSLSLSAWREFADLIGWNTLSQTVQALNWQGDQLILGKFASRSDFGHFTMANTLAIMPIQVVVVQLLRPLAAAFAAFQNDKAGLATAYRFSSQSVLAIAIPALVGLSALSEPALRLLLGDHWVEAAPMLTILTLASIPTMHIAALAPLAIIMDRNLVNTRVSVAELVVKMPLSLVAAIFFGVTGVLVVRLVALTIVALYGMLQVRALIGLPLVSQILAGWRFIAGAAVMAGFIMLIRPYSASLDGPMLLLWVLGVVATAGLIYAATVLALWNMSGREPGAEAKVFEVLSARMSRLKRRA
ncbi:MAG: oligosaccharide flippase family protein [Hyphomonadaceae bacterium]|nr:oligosaccharide flippase family protein [Hyphomonadaceae bacterium]